MKLTPKITLALLLVSLVPLGLFGALALKLARENLLNQADARLGFAAARKRQQLEYLLENYHERVRLVASRTQLRLSLKNYVTKGDPADLAHITRILSDVLPAIQGFDSIAVTCPLGVVKTSTDPAEIGTDRSDEVFFSHGKTNTVAGFFFLQDDKLRLRLAGPLILDDELVGVIVIRALAGDLESVLHLRSGLGETGEALLAMRDPNGDARYINAPRYGDHPPMTLTIPKRDASAPMSQAMLKISAPLREATDYRGVKVMAATEYLPRADWGLVVKMDHKEAMAPVHSLTVTLAAAIGGTAALVLVLSILISRALTRPLLDLAETAGRIHAGDFTRRAPENRNDELGTLAKSFNAMSGELIQLNSDLEARVVSRTTELEESNRLLRETDDRLRKFNRELEAEVSRRTGELATSEERYQLIVQGAVDGIWDWDVSTGKCTYSDHWLEHLGFAPGEFPDTWQGWIDRVHPDEADAVARALADHFNDRGRFDIVCRVRTKVGAYRWFRACGQAQWGADGRPARMAGSHTDVTEQRNAQTAMQQSQKLESLGVLAGGIAHDFNNILTAIVGNISLARIEISPHSEVNNLLAEVEKSALRAADLCKQMLAYSGQGRFQVLPQDLTAVVEDMENLLRVSTAKNVILNLQLADNLPAVTADVSQLRQVIMNLVVNASEAIGDKSGVIKLSTGLSRATAEYLASTHLPEEVQPGDYVFLEVSDTGSGMDRETLARIFDPFFTTKFTGRGLGLAALLGIVRSHHGTFKVSSEAGTGTTFKILLPCTEEKAIEIGRQAAKTEFHDSGTILIIDDEETVRATAARILERCGFTPLVAVDGRDGVARFTDQSNEIRLVLLDLTMPHMNGVEAFSQIKQLKPGQPVVLMSGYNQEAAVERFAGRGLTGFVQKPFKFDALVTAVRDALSKDADTT
ncbi:MAG: response regulator [Verrucomicrobiae bacterium]|nr:response regulator [Verrucomicrobiae bacterium]